MEKEGNKYSRRFTNIILITGFLLVLLLPAVQDGFKPIPTMPSAENRRLAEKPHVKWDNLDPFPVAYENYYSDHFSFREHLVRLKSLFSVIVLNQSPLPEKVIAGRDGWLYIVKDELNHYRVDHLLTPEQLDSIYTEMNRRKNYLDEKQIHLYFAIVPSKYTVYPEYLPPFEFKRNTTDRTDQVKDVLQKAGINVIDLRTPMLEAKSKDLIYRKTDNHWNSLGAYIASSAIVDRIKMDFPNIPDLNLNDYSLTQISVKGGNAAFMMHMENYFTDINYNFEKKTPEKAKLSAKSNYPLPEYYKNTDEYEFVYSSQDTTLPSMLVIRDSFGQAVMPFLSQSFNRSVYIFDGWHYTLCENIVENEHPDIMIYLVFESLWDGFMMGIRDSYPKSEPGIQ
jgi:alginate O-acetyltransferase complex protein AlgJ